MRAHVLSSKLVSNECLNLLGLSQVCYNHGRRGMVKLLGALSSQAFPGASPSAYSAYMGQFVSECKAARVRTSTSKAEVVVLSWKRVYCLLWVGSELLYFPK